MPIDENKSFSSYNMEQQAQMVQDRFLIRSEKPLQLACSKGVTEAQLDKILPF